MEQQTRDLSQQVARLLHEAGQRSGAAVPMGSPPGGSFAGGDASDVTTQLLVEFKDVEASLAHSCAACLPLLPWAAQHSHPQLPTSQQG
jgi:hypothetical protein